MADDTTYDFSDWTPEQIKKYAFTGEMPDEALLAKQRRLREEVRPLATPAPGTGLQASQERTKIAEQLSPTGSFSEGFRRQAASVPFGAAVLAGVPGARDVATEHGREMEKIRDTPFGSAGAIGANVLTGMAGLPARGIIGNALLSGGLEGVQDIGEGKSGVEGAIRGVVGGAAASTALSTAAKGVNALQSKFGVGGRWDNDAIEYIYNFAKNKGVDLRPGDIPGHGVHQATENIHSGATGDAGLSNQSRQLYTAIFGDGTKNEITRGFQEVDKAMAARRNALWGSLSQIPDKTTVSPAGLLSATEALLEHYPKLLSGIDSAVVKGRLEKLLADKQQLLKTSSPASANRMAVHQNEMTFDEVREILQHLTPEISKVHAQATRGDVVKMAAQALERVKGGIEGDLKRWGRQNPQKYSAYQEVLDTHKREIVPYETNPLIVNWKLGVYRDSPEDLIKYIQSPTLKTQVRRLLDDYISPVDHDAAGFMHLLDVAKRAGSAIYKAPQEPTGFGVNALSPVMSIARGATHRLAGKPSMTRFTGASSQMFRPLTSGAPDLANRLEAGLRGGLGLSSEELTRSRPRN